MEIISKSLFWLANSLLIPDIIMLLVLFVRSLMLTGSFYNQFMVKRKNDQKFNHLIKSLAPDTIQQLREALPGHDNTLFVKYLREMLSKPANEDYSDFLISCFENDADKDISLSKLLSKLGPVLGLIGTLIAMSPALVGLSTGDIAGMAYNMQVVFATTVVGLVISMVGLVTLQFKQRWYAKEVNNLDYVARVYNSKTAQK
jgi:biopolymer transport protein ExbB/TolQ